MIKVSELRELETWLATAERAEDVTAYSREGRAHVEVVVDCADGVTRRWSLGVASTRSKGSEEFRPRLYLRRENQ